MQHHTKPNARVAAALSGALLLAVATVPASGIARADQPIPASHIRFVYPDSDQTSNAPFPPDQNPKKVEGQLRSIGIVYRGRRMTLGGYLRSMRMPESKVVTVRVLADTVSVYTYR